MQFSYTGAQDGSLTPYLLGTPADLALPDALAPMLKAYDVALELWTNALDNAESTRTTLAAAPERDRQALATAIETGKPDPGGKHHATADRAALVADEHLRHTARAVTAAAEAVEVAVRGHSATVLDLAIDRERAVIAEVSAAWQQVSDQLATISALTNSIGTSANWALHVLGERVRIEASRADLRVPYPTVTGNTAALAELDRIQAARHPQPAPVRTRENSFDEVHA
jgi:hypothetical protein